MIHPMSFGSFNVPRYKPWFDENDTNNVLFVSVHGYGPRERGLEYLMPAAAFYPGTGKTVLPEVSHAIKSSSSSYSSNSNSGRGDGSSNNDQMDVTSKLQKVSEENQGNADVEDDDDDDDDDEDFDGNNNENNDDEEEEEDDEEEDEDGNAYSSALSRSKNRLAELKAMYSTPSAQASSLGVMPPLILDVGVPLPESDESGSGTYRHEWRNYFRNEIFTRLMEFKPDMIFISAGFDAHRKDTINAGYIALVEEDFEWVTTNLVRIANSCCEGRIVSALEGGYQTGGEYCSAFAKSVKAHVLALEKGGRGTCPYSSDDAEKERLVEKEVSLYK